MEEDSRLASKVHLRVTHSCHHLTNGNNHPSATRLKHLSQDLQQQFFELLKTYKDTQEDLEENEMSQRSFSKLEEELEGWLTEVEVKMITLQPYTSDENLDEQVKQLKDLNKEIQGQKNLLKQLNELYNKVQPNLLARQGIVEELNQRYEEVRVFLSEEEDIFFSKRSVFALLRSVRSGKEIMTLFNGRSLKKYFPSYFQPRYLKKKICRKIQIIY